MSADTADDLMHVISQFRGMHKNIHLLKELTPGESNIIRILMKRDGQGNPPVKVNELASVLNVTSPSITQMVTTLEKKGYVTRQMDCADRRLVNVLLTQEGQSVARKAIENSQAIFSRLLETMGEEKCRQLHVLLSEAINCVSDMVLKERSMDD